jgi:hypothetical protein
LAIRTVALSLDCGLRLVRARAGYPTQLAAQLAALLAADLTIRRELT